MAYDIDSNLKWLAKKLNLEIESIYGSLTKEEFRKKIKDAEYPGVYIFLDLHTKDVNKQIIYVGKSGSLKDQRMNLSLRVKSYFAGKNSACWPFDEQEKNIKITKFNNQKVNDEIKKEGGKLIPKDKCLLTLLVDKGNKNNAELIESFILSILLKRYSHYPKFNNEI